MRDPSAKQRIAACLRLIHVRVKLVARQLRESLNVFDRNFPLAGIERVTNLECSKRFAERMYTRIELLSTLHPASGNGRDHSRGTLNRSTLHVMQDAANTAQLLTTTSASRPAMDQMR